MKKYYLLIALLITCFTATITSQAQGIYQLWGTTQVGGPDDIGILYSTKYDGTGQDIKKTFTYTNSGMATGRNRPTLYNNKLYSLLSKGPAFSISEGAIITEYDPATNVYVRKADLFDIGIYEVAGSALTVCNNKLYGLSYNLNSDKAVLFEFNPASNALTLKYQFTAANGENPAGDLTVFNNKLYGITRLGGANNEGVIYEFDPATNIYTKKKDLSEATTGKFTEGTFSVYNNKLWAVTDSYQNDGAGEVISYDPATNVFSRKAALSGINGYAVTGEITWYNNKGYGTCSGGLGSDDMLFEFNPINNSLAKKKDFTHSLGIGCGPLVVYNDKLYTQAEKGGFGNEGTITAYNPATEQLELKAFFDATTGGGSSTALALYNGKLYGFTRYGATYGRGCLFEYSIDPILFTKKIILGGSELTAPDGKLVYINNKIYGCAYNGGNHGIGGIYEFNPATGAYAIKVQMQNSEGEFYDHGGMMVYNNKFYGITTKGGATDDGVIFEYDPATNIYTKRYDFKATTGRAPYGLLTEYGGKLYGTCSGGSTNNMGNIFQYDPVTFTYTEKVVFNANWGDRPQGELLLLNGKLYGTTALGGVHNNGTLFEYNPLANGFTKLADFDEAVVGSGPIGKLSFYKNKFYGICTYSNVGYLSGSLFCYDLANGSLTKKLELSTYPTGRLPKAGLTLFNNKLYGTTQLGGDYMFGGTLFEYDPETEVHTQKIKFTGANGRWPNRNVLQPIPAPTAPGSPGSCVNTSTVNVQAANSNQWIAFTDNQGRAVAEINANGNVLGNVAVRYFVNDGNVRQDIKGTFYLDRNLTITVANQPATPVSIRLYIRKSEFDFLKGTAGSGVTVPADISIFHNNDFCKAEVDGKATKVHTTVANWGMDYVYMADVSSFSSFYFATNTALTLPIHLESFTGKSQPAGNLLTWKASCTDPVEFTIERSVDGIQFTAIGTMSATQQDCANPFNFNDAAWLSGKNYYRLSIKEQGNITLSKIVLLDRTAGQQLQVKVLPNPVTGPQAQLQVTSPAAGTLELFVTDMSGKTFAGRKLQMMPGTQTYTLAAGSLPAGVYCIRYYDGRAWQSVKFIKQ